MPIYEYICSGCDHKFELLLPLSKAGEDAECPHCRKPARRAVSSFCSLAKDASGVTTSLGGSSCGGCGGGSCGTCGS